MLTTTWRKVLADFWTNKTRTFLMVLTITLGVFSVGFVGNIGAMMNRDMEADFNSANPAHAKVFAGPLDEGWVRSLMKVPGVKDVEGRTHVVAQLVKADGEKAPIQFEAPKSFDAIHLNQLKPVTLPNGSIPVPDWKEVIFDNSAASLGYKPGDVVEIELSNGDRRKLTFKGYVHDVTTIFAYGLVGTVDAYVTPNTAQWLGGPNYYNELLFSVSENGTDAQHVTDVAHAITDRFQKSNDIRDWQISVYNPGRHFAWSVTQGVIVILSVLGWMTVLLSTFLIINTIVALMSQHVRQIGIMKAIGGGYWQIFLMYLALVLMFGVLALAISIPLANWAAYQLCLFTATFLNYNIGPVTYDPGTMITQAVLAFLVPVLAALVPLLNGLRVSVREAISNYGIGNVSMQKQETIQMDFFPRPVLISLRNAVRKKARLILTLFVLVLGGAIFIAVLNLRLSFGQAIQDGQGYFLADINFTFTHTYPLDDVKSIAMKEPGVVSVEGWMSASAEVMSIDEKTSNEILFMAPPSDSTQIKPVITGGRWLTPLDKNAIVIGNHLLKIRPDLKVGDWITIKLQNQTMKWQIVGTYLLPGNYSIPLIYTNYEYLSRAMHQVNKASLLRVITSQHDVETQKYVSSQLEDVFRHKKIQVATTEQGAVWVSQQKSQTDVLVYFILAMAILIALVGGLGLMGMMSINVMERTREIGVMRAIGAADMDIQLIVVTEGVTVGLVSWVVAVLFSIPITYLLTYGVGAALFQSPLPATFNWTGSLIWLIGILLVAALASAIPAWHASRLTVRDTLVYE